MLRKPEISAGLINHLARMQTLPFFYPLYLLCHELLKHQLQFHHITIVKTCFLVVCERFQLRAPARLNNVHFTATAPSPGKDTKSEGGLSQLGGIQITWSHRTRRFGGRRGTPKWKWRKCSSELFDGRTPIKGTTNEQLCLWRWLLLRLSKRQPL